MKLEKKQLKEIEFLFDQSIKGVHLLFDDKARLTNILKNPTSEQSFFNSNNNQKIQSIFTGLVAKKSFREKKLYLDQLSSESYEILVRTYFHIVDNTILTTNMTHH